MIQKLSSEEPDYFVLSALENLSFSLLLVIDDMKKSSLKSIAFLRAITSEKTFRLNKMGVHLVLYAGQNLQENQWFSELHSAHIITLLSFYFTAKFLIFFSQFRTRKCTASILWEVPLKTFVMVNIFCFIFLWKY